MKKIVCIILLMFIVSSINAQKEKVEFTGIINYGVVNSYNNSSLSLMKYQQDKFKGCVVDINIGATTKNASEVYFNIFINSFDLNYSNDIEEINALDGFGIYTGKLYNLSGNIYCGPFIGGGLLISSSQINYLDNDYTIDDRLGFYVKFNLPLEYKINNHCSFGINSGLLIGKLKNKDLPTKLSTFKDNKMNGIYNYSTRLLQGKK